MQIAIILGLSLLYGYLNGLHRSANVVATIVSSRALAPRAALMLAALGITAGPFLLGVAVANTIGPDLVSPQATTAFVVMGALLAALCWNTMTFWLKIPSSNSQALIGGLVGAIWAGFGSQAILMPGLIATLVALIISPLLGMAAGFWLVRLCYLLTSAATPHINQWFNRGQIFLGFVLAVAFGANEGQKLMGVVTLGLMATGFLKTFTIPLWVIVFSASTMGIGALLGGWRLIHTLGDKFYKIRPIHGFGAQLASGTVVFAAALLGGPVSGSQVVTSAIVGAGSADRIKKVRWSIVRDIVAAWVLTLPLSMLIGAVCYWLIERV